ncbi:MAG: methyltransferase domain-containing protein [Elusimicrobia bacterium]|nr:methyltransferase domain-containing protein [Elusimicrobiota bacterium]
MSLSNDKKRMYNDLAWLFPIVGPLRDYLKETESAFRLMKRSCAPIKTILHLGSGAGRNDYVFKKHARVTGVDISPAMVKLAKKLNPEAAYHIGDMRTIRLEKTFDAVVDWDSINHILTTSDLKKAFAAAYRHLRDRGVFFFLLEIDKEQFQQNATKYFSNKEIGIEVTFIENMHDPYPRDTTYESTFVYLIRRKGRLAIETDRFLCGLYSIKTILQLLGKSGFQARCVKYKPGPEALENDGPARQKYYPAFIAIKKKGRGRTVI